MSDQNFYTDEEIQRSVDAAIDSINLINQLTSLEERTEEEENTLVRNKEHLSIMLSKTWFSDLLTDEQRTDIQNCL